MPLVIVRCAGGPYRQFELELARILELERDRHAFTGLERRLHLDEHHVVPAGLERERAAGRNLQPALYPGRITMMLSCIFIS